MEAPSLGERMESMGGNRQFRPEDRERAVRLVMEWRASRNKTQGGYNEISESLGIHPETLRNWVKQSEVDKGERPGLTTNERERLLELERENRELRRANEILKAASAFFARELDPKPPR
jgi:transposase